MNRQERLELQEKRDETQRRKDMWMNEIKNLYHRCSYRDRLLFLSVVQFLADNPPETRQRHYGPMMDFEEAMG